MFIKLLKAVSDSRITSLVAFLMKVEREAIENIDKKMILQSSSEILVTQDEPCMFPSKKKVGVESEEASTKCAASTGGYHCSKRRKLRKKKTIRVAAVSNKLSDIPPDGHSWRKYGDHKHLRITLQAPSNVIDQYNCLAKDHLRWGLSTVWVLIICLKIII
ncbi:hypothetical protein GQ457_11G022760 [Hibiscus cannabinus]